MQNEARFLENLKKKLEICQEYFENRKKKFGKFEKIFVTFFLHVYIFPTFFFYIIKHFSTFLNCCTFSNIFSFLYIFKNFLLLKFFKGFLEYQIFK